MKAVHHVSYHLPLSRARAAGVVAHWLRKHAYWWGDTYSRWLLASDIVVHGITGGWDTYFGCLLCLAGRDFESASV